MFNCRRATASEDLKPTVACIQMKMRDINLTYCFARVKYTEFGKVDTKILHQKTIFI